MEKIVYILGSTSQWRRELAMKHFNAPVELYPSNIDEKAIIEELKPSSPQEHCSLIAKAKLDFLLSQIKTPNTIIMCFDTIVFHNEILEKPVDRDDCVRMLNLWGKEGLRTTIYTAVAIGRTEPRVIKTSVESADVLMTRSLTNSEIEKMIDETDVLKSSGAMIVEELEKINSCKIEGDQSVIEGFPVSKVKEFVADILSA